LKKIGGSTVGHAKVDDIRLLPVPLPPLEEQKHISAILLDVDNLVRDLESLIAKKQGVKQAAMQELLTGKRRLPGFEGEWEVKRLGDHVRFLKNGVNSRAELYPGACVRYLHYGDIHASSGSFLSPQDLTGLPVDKATGLDRLQDGDLIFADASEDIAGVSKSVELCGISDYEAVSGLHTIAARFDKTVLADGFKGFLQYVPSFSAHLRRLAAGTKVYATNRSHISSAEVRLPTVAEQKAIAEVLMDMSNEIGLLRERMKKACSTKQGMMQQLLTGKIRLT
jgi:type I restriction enzyme S subunit